MDTDTLLNGFVGLIGALIGAGGSIRATKIQLIEQNNKQKQDENNNVKLTKDIIEAFLVNEIKYNLEEIRFLERFFLEEYGSKSHTHVGTSFTYKSDEYEKVKYRIMEITSSNTLNVIEIYQMFYMLSNTRKNSSLSRFNDQELHFIIKMYGLANDFIDNYFEQKLTQHQI